MSGIVGILNTDGRPVERVLLRAMTQGIAYRGPDAQETWSAGGVGFGHTQLRTTFEAEHEHQPCALDDRYWITADARIDGRAELVLALRGHGRPVSLDMPDALLILNAYAVWGPRCVEHLIGDFAFAVWDAQERRLFLGRDQFGVKLLYYTHVGGTFVFSNTLNCVRMHPAVSDTLNDRAIGDFLLVGHNADVATTTFADIRRVPPAHTLEIVDGHVHAPRRYWEFPAPELVRLRRHAEYVERFRDALKTAVDDRLRTRQLAISMSGGLDSTSLAALAKEILAGRGEPYEIHAHTAVHEMAFADPERHFADLTARYLGIRMHIHEGAEHPPFERWEDADVSWPEPYDSAELAWMRVVNSAMATSARVVLYGEDGDSLLLVPDLMWLLRTMPVSVILLDLARNVVRQRRRPRFGLGLMNLANASTTGSIPYPGWLDPAFEARLGLRQRFAELMAPASPRPGEIWAEVRQRLTSPYWQVVLETIDAGATRVPLVYRLPFLDLRVLHCALSTPPLEVGSHKDLLRRGMRGALPNEVLARPKTSMPPDFFWWRMAQARLHSINECDLLPELRGYVVPDRIPRIPSAGGILQAVVDLRPRYLDRWVRQTSIRNVPLMQEVGV